MDKVPGRLPIPNGLPDLDHCSTSRILCEKELVSITFKQLHFRGLLYSISLLIQWIRKDKMWKMKLSYCLSDYICCCSVAKWCLTLCDLMDCSPPDTSVHWISQARILEWVAISFSRGSSPPRDQTHVSCTRRQIHYHWATREALYVHTTSKLKTSG